jgi:hypothetical protein
MLTIISLGIATLSVGPALISKGSFTSTGPKREEAKMPRLLSLPIRKNFETGKTVTHIYTGIVPGLPFTEIIPSWNIDNAKNGSIRIEIRLSSKSASSYWYTMCDWSGDKEWSPRQSVEGQKDEFGRVLTDTLRLANPGDRVDVRLTLKAKDVVSEAPSLKLLTLNFSDTRNTKVADSWPRSEHWGTVVDVPQRAQGNYPNGKVLCSATSTSMLLWHWSKVLDKPELDRDVPEVEASVWDPVYKGAGNWPFNTAYFGSFPGMKACVSRFTGIQDLEAMVGSGIPVACSVSFDMLRGKPLSKGESGHLVLVVGFQEDGTPILNDPAFKESVRKTYPRQDFEKAWCYSHRTVYLMVPDDVEIPDDPRGIWNFRRE